MSRPSLQCSRLAVLLAVALLGASCQTSSAPAPIEIRQDDLDDEERISRATAALVARVLRLNQAYLGAAPFDFCRRMSQEERASCIKEVESTTTSEIAGVVDLEEVSDLDEGGKEWPNAQAVSGFRRLRLSVPLAKGVRTTQHEANVVTFQTRSGATTEACVFPFEHWSWSEMDRPERFSHAPIGICGDREMTVGAYLLEHAPDAEPQVLRFLAEPEARAWQSRDPERIKWDSPYTSGHPYAKYFLLDSLRWWRGGGGTQAGRNDGYAWAVRIERLPLSRIREWEKNGHMFLDIFEDGAQIELTNVTRAGLTALLAEKPAVLVDTSSPGDPTPRFELLGD